MRQSYLPRACFHASVLFSFMILQGCSDSSSTKSSSDFVTSAISANYEVQVQRNAAKGGHDYRMQARFRHDNDILELDGGDKILVSGPNEYTLSENKVFADVIYSRTETIENPLRTSFTFKLLRESQEDADESLLTVPNDFEIQAPLSDATIELNGKDTMNLSWSNNDSNSDGMVVVQDYSCRTQAQGEVFSREVSATLSEENGKTSGTLDVKSATRNGDYDFCLVDLTFKRLREGRLDTDLKSGSSNSYFVDQVTKVRINF